VNLKLIPYVICPKCREAKEIGKIQPLNGVYYCIGCGGQMSGLNLNDNLLLNVLAKVEELLVKIDIKIEPSEN